MTPSSSQPLKLNFSNTGLNILCSLLYSIFYHFIYLEYNFKIFEYMNLSYRDIGLNYVFYITISVFPILFFKGISKIASVFSLLTYIFIYVPIVDSYFTLPLPQTTTYYGAIVLCFCMSMMFITDKLMLFKNIIYSMNHHKLLSFRTFEIIVLLTFIFCVALHKGSFTFVNILQESDVMYDLRTEFVEARQGHIIQTYLNIWLQNALLPILIVSYLKLKNKFKLILTIFASMVMFMMSMSKAALLGPFLIIAFYFYFEKFESSFKKYLFPFISLGIIVTTLILYFNLNNPIVFTLSSIFIMRTICVAGWLNNYYVTFFGFNHNPFTYYTHINIVNFFTDAYPYKDALGKVVAYGEQNANANFLITDGYAALGIFGFFIATLFFILFKSWINSLSLKYQIRYLMPIMLFAIIGFLNASLFTSVLTCGFLIIYISLTIFNFKELTK